MEDTTRRTMIKRLAVIAAAGYVAPKVTRIDQAEAHKKKHGGGSGPPASPFGGGGGED